MTISYYAEDRSPLSVEIVITTGPIDPEAVLSVRVRAKLPDSTILDWTMTPVSRTAKTVTVVRVLAADGSDATSHGTGKWEAYLLGTGNAILWKTPEQSFEIGKSDVPWPTT